MKILENTKKNIDIYLSKMNKYNEYELLEAKKRTVEENINAFVSLFNLSYELYSKEEIEKFHQQKLDSLIKTQKQFLKCKLTNSKKS